MGRDGCVQGVFVEFDNLTKETIGTNSEVVASGAVKTEVLTISLGLVVCEPGSA